jgi:ATP-dependent DNA helicase RecG
MLREELQERTGITDRKYFRTDFLYPAVEAGLVEMTIPDKPTSRLQKYRLTAKGHALSSQQDDREGKRLL